jgi:hypothetical protein
MFNNFFQPIVVKIFPRWNILLADYNVLSPEKALDLWRRACGFKAGEKVESIAMKQGFFFQILKADSEGSIFFDNNHSLFYSSLDVREKITEIEQKTKEGTWTPEIYIKTVADGFELGMITAESMELSSGNGSDKELLKITTFPYTAIGLYKCLNIKTRTQTEDVNKLVSSFGWKEKEEVLGPWSIDESPHLKFEHKYFDVTIFLV